MYVNSVGTIPAAPTLSDLLNFISPELVINPGTAGGFKRNGGQIGDIYLAEKVIFHHRNIPMGKYEEYGKGSFCMG